MSKVYRFQETGVLALSSMTAVLDRESQEAGTDSVDAAAAGVLGTIGNLLGPASDYAAVNQPNSTNMTSSQIIEQETKRQRVSERVFLEMGIPIY